LTRLNLLPEPVKARRVRNLKWAQANRPKRRAASKKCALARKLRVLSAYGGACRRCKIADPDVLDLDHINNDGALDRERYRSAPGLYVQVEKENYPARFQLLCRNCNWKKHLEYVRARGA
jgi:hypothetical protein